MKKKKIIKTFFAFLYCCALSVPLLFLGVNGGRAVAKHIAYNTQTSALLNSDNNDAYTDTYFQKYFNITNSSQFVSNTTIYVNRLEPLSASVSMSSPVLYSWCSVDWHNYGLSTSITPVGFGFYTSSSTIIDIYYDNGNGGYASVRLIPTFNSLPSFSFTFVSGNTNFINYFKCYSYVYVPTNEAKDVPSSENNELPSFNSIIDDTLDDLSWSNHWLVDFDIFSLLGLTGYDSVSWANFVNYYLNYIITISVALFFPMVLLTFIHWCFNLVYALTDKEGGF